jgi:hypothetical protein
VNRQVRAEQVLHHHKANLQEQKNGNQMNE